MIYMARILVLTCGSLATFDPLGIPARCVVHRVWEYLRDITFDGRTLKFPRPGPNQRYSGTLFGNEARGAFDRGGGGDWNLGITHESVRDQSTNPPRTTSSAPPPEAATLLEQVDTLKDTWKGLKKLFGKWCAAAARLSGRAGGICFRDNVAGVFPPFHPFAPQPEMHDPSPTPLEQTTPSRIAPAEDAPDRGAGGALRRERDLIRMELSKMKDALPLLMKRRNGGSWTRQEQRYLLERLRGLSHLSPYLLVLLLPGSFVLMPMLAWWLDRRRGAPRAARDLN